MGRGRPGGNPDIAKLGNRFAPPLSEGERSKVLGVALPESVYLAIDAAALAQGVSRSQLARKVLLDYLEQLNTNSSDESNEAEIEDELPEYDWGTIDPSVLGTPVVYVPGQGLTVSEGA